MADEPRNDNDAPEEIPTTPPEGELVEGPQPAEPPESRPGVASPLMGEEIPTTPPAEETPMPELQSAIPDAAPEEPTPEPKKKPRRKKRGKERLPSACNVIDCTRDHQQFWRFTGGRSMKLVDVRDTELDEPVPQKYTRRDTSQMWQPHCQNDAWLPMDQVFLKVIQLPECEPEELHDMVELQLEKNSPIPVSQASWTFDVAPNVGERNDGRQTVVLIVADEAMVEDQVAQLEEIGYAPDRLEVPVVHQVFSVAREAEAVDGAWIYPRMLETGPVCTIAWWSGGVLRDLSVTHLSSVNNLNELTEHITASAWAGEMAGWLPEKPAWHLVAERELAERWLPHLNEWAGQGVQVHDPPETAELAAASAQRAARPLDEANLLPEEHRTRHHRDDVDRVWLAGAGWLLMFYALFVTGYFYMLNILRDDQVTAEDARDQSEQKLKPLEKEEEKFLKKKEYDRMRLMAAKCLEVVATRLPQGMTLEGLTFNDGKENRKNLSLNGVVPEDQTEKIDEFQNSLISEKLTGNEPLFAQVQFNQIIDTGRVGTGFKSWVITCELNMDRTKREPRKKKR